MKWGTIVMKKEGEREASRAEEDGRIAIKLNLMSLENTLVKQV